MDKAKPVKKKKRGRIAAAVIVCAAAAVFWGFRSGKFGPGEAGGLKVQAAALEKTSLQSTVSVSGTVKTGSSRSVTTTLSYPAKEVRVSVGDKVKAGDVLAVLDASQLEKDIASARASLETSEESDRLTLEKAKADYDNLQKDVSSGADSELISAKNAADSAEQDLKNEQIALDADKKLFSIGELAQQTLDQEERKVQSLQDALAKAKTSLQTVQEQQARNLAAAKNTYESALVKSNDRSSRISLEKQEQQLKDATITAPVGGTITAKNLEVGSAPAGTLFTISDTDRLTVSAEVKEYDVGSVAVGQKAEIRTDATGDEKIAGVVTRIAPTATSGTEGTGSVTFTTEIQITGSSPKIRAGMTAKTDLILEKKSGVYAVPYDAVQYRDDGTAYVFAAQKDADGKTYRAAEVPVKTGLETDVSVEISGSGLADGLLVLSEPDGVTAGAALQVTQVKS